MALGVLAALAPSAAWSQFGSPVPLTSAGETADQAEIAIDADGAARVVHRELDGAEDDVYLIHCPQLGPPFRRRISTGNAEASDPVIALLPSGDQAVAYQQASGIKARNVPAAGAPGAVLSLAQGAEPAVTEADVKAWTLWYRTFGGGLLPSPGRAPGDRRIQARSISSSGALGPIENISPADGDASAGRVVADADGDVLFVWLHYDGNFARVLARSLSAAGALGPIQNISPAGADADHPQVAMTSNGRAVIVWQRFNESFSEAVIETRTRAPGGGLTAIVPLSSPGASSVEPQVALDSAGDALFIWEVQDSPNSRVQARHRSAAGVLKPIQNITAATGFAYDAQVARSPDGDSVIIWSRNSSGGNIAVQARTRADGGQLGPIQTLSNGPLGTNHPSPRVAMNDDGDAVAVWGRFDGSNDRLWAAFGP